jgi:hypothetical protein
MVFREMTLAIIVGCAAGWVLLMGGTWLDHRHDPNRLGVHEAGGWSFCGLTVGSALLGLAAFFGAATWVTEILTFTTVALSVAGWATGQEYAMRRHMRSQGVDYRLFRWARLWHRSPLRMPPDPVPVAQLEELVSRYSHEADRLQRESGPDSRGPIVDALLEKGRTLGRLGRLHESIAVFDDLVSSYTEPDDPALHTGVVQALFWKSIALLELNRSHDIISVHRFAAARFGADPHVADLIESIRKLMDVPALPADLVERRPRRRWR